MRDRAGLPAVIRNHPLLHDGTPMPTRYWLVDPVARRAVDRLEAAGGVRAAEAAVDAAALAAAHDRYAAERDAALPAGWTGPRPSGGVGGTRRGVKCLHAHYAWYLAGGDDPVGRWVAGALAPVRPARGDDLPALREVERAAGAPFREIGMAAVADDEPLPLEGLAGYQRDGRAWVAVDAADRPVGYALADVVDGTAYVAQVSVHPTHGGRRLGARLLDVVDGWAAERGLAALTLTTFAEVPWNAPYYERLGFRVVAGAEVGEGLARIRAVEAAGGLDAWPRVVMRRELRA